MGENSSPILQVRGGGKKLPNGRQLFSGVELELSAGESLALVGRSGSGKTTLLAALGLMDRFDNGSFVFKGVDVADAAQGVLDKLRADSIGFIFQRFALVDHLSVLENVMMPLRHCLNLRTSESRERAHAALDLVGLSQRSKNMPLTLSGGEQQRVAIARALIRNPSLILADEPTGSLDIENGSLIIELLNRLVRESQVGVIVVTHDVDIARRLQRGAVLHDGRLEFASRDLLTNSDGQ